MFKWLIRYFVDHEAVQEERDRLLAEAQQEREHLLSEARCQADAIQANAFAKGFDTGKEAGLKEGHTAGYPAGMVCGYNALAKIHGELHPVTTTKEIPTLSLNELAAMQPQPNVYDTGRSYVTRVLNGNNCQMRVFPDSRSRRTTGLDAPHIAFTKAMIARNSFLPSAIFPYQAYDEMFTESREAMADLAEQERHLECWQNPSYIRVRVAMEFHRRMILAGPDVSMDTWLGDDPGNRFQIDHTDLYNWPWPTLWTRVPEKVKTAMIHVGMGPTVAPRTVRNLLLITADEFLDAANFGDASLRSLRNTLASWGIALWGDPLPNYNRAGQTDVRSIDLT
jgi:hypothetical protein